MPTIEELDRDCPEHDRSSCSDEKPVNAGVDLRYGSVWCRRCEGIWRMKEQDDARDAARLDWVIRQGPDFVCGVIMEAHGDGDFLVHGMGNVSGQGKTGREAIDAAIAAQAGGV